MTSQVEQQVTATIEITAESFADVGSGRREKDFTLKVGDFLLCQGQMHKGGRSLRTGMPVVNQGWKLDSVQGPVTQLKERTFGEITRTAKSSGPREIEISISERLFQKVMASA
jgi:hypothetical protein